MNDLLAALLLGIIEGITEFLPISSTGHLLIAERWLGARSDLFNVAIQAGAILAVVLIYRERLWQLTLGLGKRETRDYALKLALSFVVTAVLGLLVKKLGFELPETIGPVAWALLIGGFVMLGAEAIDARRKHVPDDSPAAISWGVAALVGVAQVVAGVFPGTSRSAAAIFAALLFGRGGRVAATEFAFLIGIPTMFAATGYELLHTLKDGGAVSEDWSALGVAFVVSALTAFAAVKWLLRYIQTHRFTVFAWYRIALAAALLGWLHFGSAQAAQATATEGRLATPATSASAVVTTTPVAAAIDARAARFQSGARAPAGAGAGAGDAGTARAQDIARFRSARLCVQAVMYRNLLRGATLETFVVPPDNPSFNAREREEQLKEAKAFADLLDRADLECPKSPKAALDGSIYELALNAANAGDEQAASCYAAGGFPIPPEQWQRPEFQARFRDNASRLIERGVQAGDWPMVMLAELQSNPKPHPFRYVLTTPESPPGMLVAATTYAHADAERAYSIAWLKKLGSGDGVFHDNGYLEFTGRSLTEAQRQAALAWAEDMLARHFDDKRYRFRDLEPCPLG